MGECDACKKCGYAFKHVEKKESKSETRSAAEDDVLTRWMQCAPAVTKLMKARKVAKIIVFLLPMVFVGVIIYYYRSFVSSDPFEQLLNFNKTIDMMRAMVILICIVESLDLLFEPILEMYERLKCCNWIKKENIDVETYLDARSQDMVDPKTVQDITLIAEAEFMSKHDNNKIHLLSALIVQILGVIAAFVCFGICAMQNLTELMSSHIWEYKFQFQYIPLIVAGVVIVVALIAYYAIGSIDNKKYNAWLSDIYKD